MSLCNLSAPGSHGGAGALPSPTTASALGEIDDLSRNERRAVAAVLITKQAIGIIWY
jgi:hypothetical protein